MLDCDWSSDVCSSDLAFVGGGHRRDETAILYRTTAQSRLFEEALLQAQVPYRVYGGLRFFERAEVKDALAYLRLLSHGEDDASLERVINTPPRGVGERTLELLRAQARERGCSLWQAALELRRSGLAARTSKALESFLHLIDGLREATQGLELADLVGRVVQGSGLPEYYEKSKDGRGVDRIENLEELVNAARRFGYEGTDEGLDALDAFLSHAALESGDAQGDAMDDCVQLMTLHSAKGLEFPLVFIAGMEEDLFPHKMSAQDPDRLEEERRLCYVGMTRAMRQLYLTYTECRRMHGSESYPMRSRFLSEIPAALVEEVRAGPNVSLPLYRPAVAQPAAADDGFRLGQRVTHATFGEGVILNQEGQGAHTRVQVNFQGVGSKWLVLAYAKLRPVGA
jgi:DNA helicase-2/ATP-dependent DNA helicase PcrA